MKSTTINNFYRFAPVALIAIGIFAFFNANTGGTQASSSSQPTIDASTTYSRNRHTITLALNNLSDLKVEEGERVEKGDLISDRTSERTKLLAKKQRLTTTIEKAKLPLPPSK